MEANMPVECERCGNPHAIYSYYSHDEYASFFCPQCGYLGDSLTEGFYHDTKGSYRYKHKNGVQCVGVVKDVEVFIPDFKRTLQENKDSLDISGCYIHLWDGNKVVPVKLSNEKGAVNG